MSARAKTLPLPHQKNLASQLGNTVINLSNKQITKTQYELLNKGLKFIPTPKLTTIDPIIESAQKFSRLIKLKYFFKDKDNGHRTKFTSKSTWNPPNISIRNDLLTHLDKMIEELHDIPIIKEKDNLTKKERQSLNTLKNDNDIVIKKGDKGSCCVIMNRTDYIKEAEHQLSNPKHYKKLDAPIYPETRNLINKILKSLIDKSYINEKQYDYLSAKKDSRERHLYTLPKIHKNPETEWFIPNTIPKGRPIISDCASESYFVSEYIDHFLMPLSMKHDAYLKDTTDFVEKIKKLRVPANAYLISIDVQSMYTNIDNDSGLLAVKKAFDRHPDKSRPDKEILDLLEIGLKRNDFTFNDQVYLQCSGTAMGKRWAPSYANLFMAQWEREVLPGCPLSPIFYQRFLDDIFLVWTHSLDEFWQFFNILNNYHPSIKLTAEVSDKSINFLDTTVFKSENIAETNKLDIKVYFKKTDTHQLLYKSSFHPKHTFSGIIKSQILRFHRICTRTTDFNQACYLVFSKLKERGYTDRYLRKIKNDTLSEIKARTIQPLQPFQQFGARQCMNTRCGSCKHLNNTNSFQNKHSRKQFPINESLSCKSKNLIYLISCKKCQLQYVGETQNTLRERLTGHLSDIRRKTDKPISLHFNSINHSINDLIITPIEKLKDNATDQEQERKQRLIREDFWIDKLNTLTPNGLNSHKTHSIIPLVIQFNKTATKASSIIKKYYSEIQESLPRIYTDKIITAFSKNKNLTDILVPSKLKTLN